MFFSPSFYISFTALFVATFLIAGLFIKRGGKALTPKRIYQAIQVRVQDYLHPLNGMRGVYRNYAEATADAPATKPLGYDSANAGNWYYSKLTGVQLEDYPVLYWLKDALNDSGSLFEIGGHVGVAYYGFSRVLEYPKDLTWTIMDVASVMKAGETLARERGCSNLQFAHGGLQTVKGADILLSVGALQYLDTTLADIVAELQHRPKHIIINVTPVYDGPDFTTLQNLGSVYCAYHVFNRRIFVESLASLGYRLVDAWTTPRPFRIPGRPDKAFNHYSGFYFKANSSHH